MQFVFYDLESSGISTAFDQPLQFAAIRTDENLNETERVEIRCRIAPHVLPSPQAMHVTGMHPDMLVDPESPSLLEFAQQVYDLVKGWAPACWTGYNSLRFDEEMLRQTFFQNLLPDIYATQFNGNRRVDILHAVHAVRAFHPDLMAWPEDMPGHQHFRLESLAPANGFEEHDAHDALGDAAATLHLARIIASGAPETWKGLLENTLKAGVQKKLEAFRPLRYVTRIKGATPRAFTGCLCGYSASNPSQAVFLNLDADDPKTFLSLDEARLIEAMRERPDVFMSVTTNRMPLLFDAPDASDEHDRRAEEVARAPEFRQRAGQAFANRYQREPRSGANLVERQIHAGFYSPEDKKLLREFRDGAWRERRELVRQFEDERLRRLGLRLVAFYSPEMLSDSERARYAEYLQTKWNAPEEDDVEWTTAESARDQISEMRDEGEAEAGWLEDVSAFIEKRLGESKP